MATATKKSSKKKKELYPIELHKGKGKQPYFWVKNDLQSGNQISKSSENYSTKAKCIQGLLCDLRITYNSLNVVTVNKGSITVDFCDCSGEKIIKKTISTEV